MTLTPRQYGIMKLHHPFAKVAMAKQLDRMSNHRAVRLQPRRLGLSAW